MDFFDFEIRAWQTEDDRTAVLVHSSPAGEMRRPVLVASNLAALMPAIAHFRDESWSYNTSKVHEEFVSIGRALASMLLPPPVHALFRRSIDRTPQEAGLRLRLCLDDALIDLPWELLFDPDEIDDTQTSGFLALGGRLSIVRAARVSGRKFTPGANSQRLVFAGALYGPRAGDDEFECRPEHTALQSALSKISNLVTVEDFVDASGDHIEQLLSEPTVIFHYAGHAEAQNGKGVLLRSAINGNAEWLSLDALVPMLRRAGVQLVVMSSCNGGNWPIVKPLLGAGLELAAIIGIQGQVDTKSSVAFCGKLYQALALGLSIDEAVTWARFHLVEQGSRLGADRNSLGAYAWPRYMVYMPVSNAVLFAKPNGAGASRLEDAAREERAQTINHVTNIIGSVYGGSVSGISGTVESRARSTAESGERVESFPTRAVSKNPRKTAMPRNGASEPASAAKQGKPGTPREYLDFTIELRDLKKASDTFTAVVLPSVVGESAPVKVLLDIFNLMPDLRRLEEKKMSMSKLMLLGERLGDRLLPTGEVRDLFSAALAKAGRTGGVRLRLVIRDPLLAQLPWEYAYIQKAGAEKHRSGFLVLNPQVSIVRHEAMPEEPWPLVAADPSRLRVVVATAAITHANIEGLGEYDFAELDLDVERNAIVAAVQDLKVEGVTVDAQHVLNEATADDITNALVPGADVFHFAGHGYFSTPERDTAKVAKKFGGMILLHQEHGSTEGVIMRADDLAMSLQRAGVRLAVLGACESARRDSESQWSGVAPALVRRGLPAAVAMQYEVIDEQAIAFSRMLYTCIAAGLSLDEAVSAGRQAMLGNDGNNIEWGGPVIYMRSTSGVLFPEIVRKPTAVAAQVQMTIDQIIGTIEEGGDVTGLKAESLSGGSFTIIQKAESVKGSMTGAVIGKL